VPFFFWFCKFLFETFLLVFKLFFTLFFADFSGSKLHLYYFSHCHLPEADREFQTEFDMMDDDD
jgi:hypothetical protein